MTHHLKDPLAFQDDMSLRGQMMIAFGFTAYLHPMLKVQNIMQVQNVLPYALENNIKFKGFLSGYRFMSRRDGVNSLWNGFFLKATIDIFDFVEEDITKKVFKLKDYIPDEEEFPTNDRVIRYFKGNLFTKVLIAASLFPIYNIWVRLSGDPRPVTEFAGVLDCVDKVWKSEGIKGFFKGFSWSLLSTLVSVGMKTLNFKLQTKKNTGQSRKSLMYPLMMIESTVLYGIETIGVRSIIGLPLVAPAAVGFAILPDVYSGFSIKLMLTFIEMGMILGFSQF
jgi:hypothetical protein